MATAVIADTSYLIDTARTQIRDRFRLAREYLTREEAKLLRELENIEDNCRAGQQSQFDDDFIVRQHSQIESSVVANKAIMEISRKMEEILTFPVTHKPVTSKQAFLKLFTPKPVTPKHVILKPVIPKPVTHKSVIPKPVIPKPANLSLDIPLPFISDISGTNKPPSPLFPSPIIPIPDYSNKSIPVITCCKQCNVPGELYSPRGLAVEPLSGRIYIADEFSNRVQVFIPNGEYSFMFSSNMYWPWGICINIDTVYVSHRRGCCITAYKLDGTYLNKVGSYGTMNGQFKLPRGLAVSPATGLLYVCDCYNNRVQLFDKEQKFHSLFAEKLVSYPNDVILTQHLVIILDEGDPCIHLFDITDLSLLRSIISKGEDEQVSRLSFFFTVDRKLNILLTDYTKHCVCVFSQSGVLITQFGKEGHSAGEFYQPTGIAIDNQNRIVVVSENENSGLQLF